MLENIKTTFFIKNLFLSIHDKNKLKIAKYNKRLQKIIDINLNHYKIFSGRYIIYEEKGKGKEYDKYKNNILIYEGEFLNGERNGKGKEYNEGKLLFEGEFFKGKQWNGIGFGFRGNKAFILKDGKGYKKEHWRNNKLSFEGEYLNGERNGEGKLYNQGILIFEGEYLNGKMWNGKIHSLELDLENGNGYIKKYSDFYKSELEFTYKNGLFK